MHPMKRLTRGIRPIQALPLGFLCIILVGTALLTLPSMTTDGQGLSFLDAMFTATSASCVTGLAVADTGTYLTPLGQGTVLFLIQLGGLGFMTVATVLFLMLGRRISLRERMTIAESLGEDGLHGVVKLSRYAAILTFSAEFIGALLLALRFIPAFGWGKGLWYALFHSISAFCNAGFDLFGGGLSLMEYAADPLVTGTIMALIVTGGLGFAVLVDFLRFPKNRRLRLQSKIVLWGTAILLLGGAALFLLFEHDNSATMGSMGWAAKLGNSLFQSVTCRTAGFYTFDQAAMTDASKLWSTFLMFIGAAPAGTGGGVKVTTIALVLLTAGSYIKNRPETTVFSRRIPQGLIHRALCLLVIALTFLMGITLITAYLERDSGLSLIDMIYELTSALCTVGLSAGLTAAASSPVRLLMIGAMYMGRVGMLTLALALGSRTSAQPLIRYPEESIMVG